MADRLPGQLGRLSDTGIRLFNERVAQSPGILRLSDRDLFEEGPDGIRIPLQGLAEISFKDVRGWAYYSLWKVIDAGLLDRVKRCEVCGRWVFDDTRNKSAERCSAACTTKWWNRSRRRIAAHAQYRERKPQKRGRTGGHERVDDSVQV